MKVLFKSLLFAGIIAGMVSCSDENPWASQQGAGKIRLTLSASSDLVESAGMTRSTETLDTPEVNDFSVSLNKNDESYSRTWNSLSDFAEEDSFPTGVYTITAFYGDVEGEGFEKPYFEGTADVTVLEARTTDVCVEASLANCLVSVGYTDAFRNYFSAWKATVHSAGNGFHDLKQGEIRPVYIVPGEVEISLELTSRDGKSTKVQPTSFTAEAKHRYHLVYDVNNGNNGDAQLSVIFDDTVEQETVNIDLTDELFSTPAPVVTSTGFANGVAQEALEGSATHNDFIYNVVCRGKIKSAVFTVNSSFVPSFGSDIDLCTSSSEVLLAAGLDAKGFVNNPDRLAMLNVSEFVAGLPVGHHEMTLVVKDTYTRVSDPITLVVDNVPTELNVTPIPTKYGTNDAVVEVQYNGTNPKKNITFTTPDDYGSWYQVEVKNVEEVSRSRAFETKTYRFTIAVSDTERDQIPVKVYLRGVEKGDFSIPVIMPKYTVVADAYANKVAVKISPADETQTAAITNAVRVFVTGSGAEAISMNRDAKSGLIWIKGLKPKTKYSIQTSLVRGDNPTMTPAVEVTTEDNADVPNGDFNEIHQTIHYDKINSGGRYKAGVKAWTYNWEVITVNEPDGWASINAKTCYSGSTCQNSWFMVPSTLADGDAVTIRSVAYDHAGTEPAEKNWGTFGYTYYNPNLPANIASRAAGELFLGSYSYNGSDSRTDGIGFASRPTSMTFEYKYAPVGNETGEAYITLLDADGKELATARTDISKADDYQTGRLTLPAYPFGRKAAKLRICFRSTKGDQITTIMPSEGNIDDVSGVAPTDGGFHLGVNASKSLSVGSVLTIGNVKLNY